MKLGLVLDGGGGKGAYQIGVWKAMREFGLDTQVQAIAGTSVGGLNAALFVQGDFDLAYLIWSKEIRRIHGMEMQKKLSELIDDYIDFSKIMESPIDCFLATYCPFQTGEYLNCNNDRNIPESLVHGEMTYYNLRMISQKECRILFQTCTTPKAVMLATSALPVLCRTVWMNGRPHRDGGLKDNTPVYPLAFGSDCDTVLAIRLSQIEAVDTSQFPHTSVLEIVPNVDSRELSLLNGTLNFDPAHAKRLIEAGYRDSRALFEGVLQNRRIADAEVAANRRKAELVQQEAEMRSELRSAYAAYYAQRRSLAQKKENCHLSGDLFPDELCYTEYDEHQKQVYSEHLERMGSYE